MEKILTILSLIIFGLNSFIKAQIVPVDVKLPPPVFHQDRDADSYQPDRDYMSENAPNVLDQFKPGWNVAGSLFSRAEIRSAQLNATREGRRIVKFDTLGNIISDKYDAALHFFGEAYDSLKEQSFVHEWIYHYEYDDTGRILFVEQKDISGNTLASAGCKYDSAGRLVQVGPLVLVYDSGNLPERVESQNEIEEYRYDTAGRLTRIYFRLRPGIAACGNGISEWEGVYNSKGQLIAEYFVGLPEQSRHHRYTDEGLLIETKIEQLFENKVIRYVYEKGRLKSEHYFDEAGRLLGTKDYFY